MLKTIAANAERHIYFTTATLSLFISLWLYATSDIISRDSLLYVQVGHAFLNDGLAAAFKVWSWPFYSIAFATIHKVTGLGLEQSAHVLTILLEVIISLTFVKIYSRIAFEGARLWVAMLFILTFVTFNDYKGDIIREYGFWTFSLIALYQFIVYFQTQTKSSAMLWQLAIFSATLFRPEAVVYAILAPFYFLFAQTYSFSERIKHLLTLNSIFYSVGALVLISLLLSSQLQAILINNLPPQIDYFSAEKVFYNFNLAADNFVKHVLPFDYSANYSHLIIASGLVTMLLVKLISNFTIVYSGIWLTGSYHKWINNKAESQVVYYFASIALLILLVFITSRLFVSSRYTVFLLLLIGLVFTQYLDYLIAFLARQQKKIWLVLLGIFITIQFLDSIISLGAKKTPIKLAGEYTRSLVKPGEKIACNEKRFVFYSNFSCQFQPALKNKYQSDTTNTLLKQDYRYVLMWVKHKNDEMLQTLQNEGRLHLLKEFSNRKNDKAMLFELRLK